MRTLRHSLVGALAGLITVAVFAASLFLVLALYYLIVEWGQNDSVGSRFGYFVLTVFYGMWASIIFLGVPGTLAGAVGGGIICDNAIRRRTCITAAGVAAAGGVFVVLVVFGGFSGLDREGLSKVGALIGVALLGAASGALAGMVFLRLFRWLRSVRLFATSDAREPANGREVVT